MFPPMCEKITYGLLDPPDIAFELAPAIGLLLLSGSSEVASRGKQKEDSLDGLWDELQELGVERK